MGGIRITDTRMSSADTLHTATVTGGGWQVSWLPGRTLDRNQAITAMTIASAVGGTGVPRADDPVWLHLDGWAAELNMTAPSAVMRVSETPARDSQPAPGAATSGPRTAGPASTSAKMVPGTAASPWVCATTAPQTVGTCAARTRRQSQPRSES